MVHIFFLCFSVTHWTFLFETAVNPAVRYIKRCRTESAQRYAFLWDRVALDMLEGTTIAAVNGILYYYYYFKQTTTSPCLVVNVRPIEAFEAFCMYYKQPNKHVYDRNYRIVSNWLSSEGNAYGHKPMEYYILFFQTTNHLNATSS